MLSQILGSSWVGLDPWVKEKNMGQYWVGKIPTQPGGSRVGLNPFGALPLLEKVKIIFVSMD